MKLNEYQSEAKKTAIFDRSSGVTYCVLGLCGESGEVADKVKRVYRDPDVTLSCVEQREGLLKELGDVLWYLANLSDMLGFTLEEVASSNLEKLRDRALRGVISGEGDER